MNATPAELEATTPAEASVVPPLSTGVHRGTQIGRYIVLDVLGKGGMGIVYAAFDPELDRKIAVKVLRAELAGEPATTRLLREGRAVARLAHPNVVTVFDVGTHDGSVFVAMELVDGASLDERLESPRPWRDVVDWFVQAGRGLIAAHDAGIVHRDFKPANVLVGNDGRVRVTDFGLARLDAGEGSPRGDDAAPSNLELTRTGAIMGTPAYMAPEQFEAATVDERTDQFSFAVALYEGLYGERPFRGTTAGAIYEQIVAGEIAPPPAGTRVPARLRALVVRGLAAKPGDRHPRLADFLAALEALRRPRAPRWIAAALVPIAIAATFVVARGGREEVCAGGRPQIDAVWSTAARAQMRQAFLATGKPYAAAAFAQAEGALDRYAASWADMHGEACRATAVRKEQSAKVLDLRMTCLDQRRNQLREVVGLLDHADADVVQHASEAVAHLGDLSPCADRESLLAPVPLPASPPLRAEVAALRGELSRALALSDAGKDRAAMKFVPAIVARSRTLGYQPLEAESLHILANLQFETGDAKGATESLRAAVVTAEASGHQLVAAKAWRGLIVSVGLGEGDHAGAMDAAAHAAAILGRLDPDGLEMADLQSTMSTVLREKGDYAAARKAANQAIAIFEKKLPAGDPKIARAYNNLGNIEWFEGNLDKAVMIFERVRRDLEHALGPNHPLVAKVSGNLASVYQNLGKYPEARAANQRDLSISEEALGPNHPELITALNEQGNIAADQGHDDEAIAAYRRALSIAETALSPDHPRVSAVLVNLAIIEHHHGDLGSARAHLERALAIDEKRLGPDHPALADTLGNLSSLAVDQGKLDEARRFAERALAIRSAKFGPDARLVGDSYIALANAISAGGKHAEAITLLEKGLAILDKPGVGEHTRSLAIALYNYGDQLYAVDRFAPAEAAFRRALALFEKEAGPDAPELADIATALAGALDKQGKEREAAPFIERALAMRAKMEQMPRQLAETRATAARILWRTSRDHARAIELARQALPVLAKEPGAGEQHAALAKWMAARGIR